MPDRTREPDLVGSALVELMAPITLTYYARLCGWALARAYARSGDPVRSGRLEASKVSELAVKIRAGQLLEVKQYHGSPGILNAAGRARGRIESRRRGI